MGHRSLMPAYHIIMNRGAGTAGSAQVDAVKDAFAGSDYYLHLIKGDPVAAARKAAADKQCRVLVAAGGDGTVGAVATVVIERNLTLGILPAGTLNHFARDAGVPSAIPEAAAAVLHGKPHRLDYATVNGRVSLNNISLGVYPKLVRKREASQRKLGKWPAAAMSALTLLRRPLHRSHFLLRYNGRVQRITSPFIFIGNNDYHTKDGGLGERSRLDSGRLTLFVYVDSSWLRFVGELARVFAGRRPRPVMKAAHPTKLVIGSKLKQLEVAIDGEVVRLPPPLEIVLHPKGLPVLK